MARTRVYRVSVRAYYVVMENSTIFIRIGDMDTDELKSHIFSVHFSD